MKKNILIFSLVLAFILASTFSSYIYAATHTLEELAKIFNNCNTVKQYKDYNYNLSAKSEGNKLKLESNSEYVQTSVEYTLNGSILSATTNINGLTLTTILLDCVGQLNGYEDGALFETSHSDEISNYTVEKEGFEIKELQNENYEVKIDIDKKIPIVDSSKIYLNTSDFDMIKEYNNTNGIKSKMSYDVSINNDEGIDYIYIGERDNITESTYKSILSAIEVIFDDSNTVEYFKSNYSAITEGSKKFAGFAVEVDVDNDKDISTFDGSKITKVTIDRKVANGVIELFETVKKAQEIFNNNNGRYTEDSLARLRDTLIDGEIFIGQEKTESNEIYQEKIKNLKNEIGDAIDALEKEYTLEGAEQTYKIGESTNLTFRFDIDYDTFKTYGEIWVDEMRIEEDNYTSKNGSTIITFNDEYTKTLSEGGHHLEIPLAQGRLGIAKTDFYIEKVDTKSDDKIANTEEKNVNVSENEVSENKSANTNNKADEVTTNNPKTGDNIAIYIVMVVVSVMMITTLTVIMKRKK